MYKKSFSTLLLGLALACPFVYTSTSRRTKAEEREYRILKPFFDNNGNLSPLFNEKTDSLNLDSTNASSENTAHSTRNSISALGYNMIQEVEIRYTEKRDTVRTEIQQAKEVLEYAKQDLVRAQEASANSTPHDSEWRKKYLEQDLKDAQNAVYIKEKKVTKKELLINNFVGYIQRKKEDKINKLEKNENKIQRKRKKLEQAKAAGQDQDIEEKQREKIKTLEQEILLCNQDVKRLNTLSHVVKLKTRYKELHEKDPFTRNAVEYGFILADNIADHLSYGNKNVLYFCRTGQVALICGLIYKIYRSIRNEKD